MKMRRYEKKKRKQDRSINKSDVGVGHPQTKRDIRRFLPRLPNGLEGPDKQRGTYQRFVGGKGSKSWLSGNGGARHRAEKFQ